MNKRILVIDDDGVFCSLVRDILERQGYEARFAGDGETGLSMASQGADLILLDLMVPGIDGWGILERLKEGEQTRRIPIIVCSTRSERINPLVAQKLGAVDYILKPFTMDDFISRIQKALGREDAR